MKLAIVVGSTRENRVSLRQAQWTLNEARKLAGEHEWELIDLKAFDLPFMAEPQSPMSNQHRRLSENVTAYLEKMTAADGFIIVTPEYNHGMPAPLKNALDLVDYQLMRKPIAVASHGSVGGARANEQVRLVVNSSLGAVPIPASHTFYGKVNELINDDGVLAEGQEVNERAVRHVIESLVWYADALKTAREKQ